MQGNNSRGFIKYLMKKTYCFLNRNLSPHLTFTPYHFTVTPSHPQLPYPIHYSLSVYLSVRCFHKSWVSHLVIDPVGQYPLCYCVSTELSPSCPYQPCPFLHDWHHMILNQFVSWNSSILLNFHSLSFLLVTEIYYLSVYLFSSVHSCIYLCILVYISIYIYLPTPLHKQDMTQGQFLSGV